jgi:hypothetical protein
MYCTAYRSLSPAALRSRCRARPAGAAGVRLREVREDGARDVWVLEKGGETHVFRVFRVFHGLRRALNCDGVECGTNCFYCSCVFVFGFACFGLVLVLFWSCFGLVCGFAPAGVCSGI